MQLTLKEMAHTWVEHGGAVFPAHVITDPLTPIVARTRSGELIVALANEVWRHASWTDKESDNAVVKFRLALRYDLTRLTHLCPTITDAVREVLATDLISQRVESAAKTLSAEESARQFEAAIGDVDLRMPEETGTAEPTCHPSAVTDKTVLDSLISGKGTLTVQINGTDQIVEIPTANFKYDGDTDRLVLTEPVTLPFPSGDLTLNGAVFMTPEQVARGAIASGLRLKETPCSHVFKSKHCGYTGEADTCDKSSVQCESFGNMHNFAGLPPRPQTDSDAALDAYSDAALDESFALPSDDVEEEQWALPCMSATPDFDVAGYESLADVLLSAYRQAAIGKGKERHACGRPFDEQPMQDLIRLHGLGFATGQASKKASEALRLPTPERQEAELLGAINYLAGAVIAIRRAAEVDEE